MEGVECTNASSAFNSSRALNAVIDDDVGSLADILLDLFREGEGTYSPPPVREDNDVVDDDLGSLPLKKDMLWGDVLLVLLGWDGRNSPVLPLLDFGILLLPVIPLCILPLLVLVLFFEVPV